MPSWLDDLFVLVYIGGYLPMWWYFTRIMLEIDEAHNAKIAYSVPAPLTNGDRVFALAIGWFIALFWPVAYPGRQLFIFITRNTTLLHTPNEIAAAEREELEKLRKLAAEHNLPMV